MLQNNYKNFIIYICACWLILLPLLFFPLSGDLALFLSSIRVMDAGGLPYKDLIDIKPPLLFYLFQTMTKVFGMGEYGVRLFDFIIQTITISLLYITILKATNKKLPAFMSGILYSFAYIVLNFNNTTQIESLLGICLIPVIYAQVFHREKYWIYFPLAFIIGIFTGMKYTLGIILAAMLADDAIFFRLSYKSLIKKYSIAASGFTLAFAIGLLPYSNPEILQGFREMSNYFSFYAKQPAINEISIKYMLVNLTNYFGDVQSIFLFTLFLVGTAFMIKSLKDKNELNDTLRITFLLIFALLFACFVERKLFIYHLSRINSAFAIFWAIGAYTIINYIRTNSLLTDKFAKFSIVAISLFYIPLSPIPRWTQIVQLPILYYSNPAEYDNKFNNPQSESILRVQHKQVAEYINQRIKFGDKVINASTGSSMLTYLFRTNNLSKFCQSSYYVFPQASAKHINDFAQELREAKYLVAQTNDCHFHINGFQLSTYERIIQIPQIKQTIDSLYTLDTTIGNFKIFKHLADSRTTIE